MSAQEGPSEVGIHGIAGGGAGVGRLADGTVIFVHRTAPGDRALVEVVERKRRWARGRLVELVEEGPGRRDAPCPHYDRCGGCTLEHLRYGDQLRWKSQIVTDALTRIGRIELSAPLAVEPAPKEFRYRSRATFHLQRGPAEAVRAGFRVLEAPGSIVDMGGECLLLDAVLSAVWDGIRAEWGPGAKHLPEGEELRLTLRRSGAGAILVVAGGEGGGNSKHLHSRVAGLRAVWSEAGDGELRLLAGEEEVREEWLGEELLAGPRTFLQVNREAGEALHNAVLRRVGSPKGLRVVDGYCGVGAYGRRLARHGADVVGIESDPGAVSAARRGAPAGFRVVEGTVERHLAEALPADLVIVNPPRTGLDDRVPGILLAQAPPRIVYVSCDPATLARDLERLSPRYQVESVEGHDLFPQTAHVEALVVLTRDERPGEDGR